MSVAIIEHTPERMILVDAHGLLFQVFHAIPEMSSPSGLPTNALFGFTRDMPFVRKDHHPDYSGVRFRSARRHLSGPHLPEYKAHRGADAPDAMRPQIGVLYQVLEAMRIPALTKEDFEADDVLATVARAAAERGIEVLVCTSDKDCRQLLSDRVKLYNLRKHTAFDAEALQKDQGNCVRASDRFSNARRR